MKKLLRAGTLLLREWELQVQFAPGPGKSGLHNAFLELLPFAFVMVVAV